MDPNYGGSPSTEMCLLPETWAMTQDLQSTLPRTERNTTECSFPSGRNNPTASGESFSMPDSKPLSRNPKDIRNSALRANRDKSPGKLTTKRCLGAHLWL